MKYIRHVRPLCWLFLLSLGGIGVCWNVWSWQFTSTSIGLHAIVTALILMHAGIYWFGLSREMKKHMQWLALAVQIGLILCLTQLTHLVIMTLTLSPLLFLATATMLKRVGPTLILISGYLALLFIYMHTIGPEGEWNDLWSGGYAPAVGVLGVFSLLLLIIYLQKEQGAHDQTRTLLHELDEAHAQLASYALHIEELTMLTERQRLARELHDTLSQGMAGLVMQLDAAHAYFSKGQYQQGDSIVEQAMGRARTMLTETRYVINDLRAGPPRPDDLPELVQEESERFTQMTGIPCETELAALAHTPADNCEHVLRTITEGLTNIARHAQAHQVHIQTAIRYSLIEIEISDDGIGFDPATVENKSGHYGLIGLRERARLIGGEFDIRSVSGAGTRMRLRVPCQVKIGITI